MKEGLKAAQQKVISYAQVSAITQEPNENPTAFLGRLKEALQKFTNLDFALGTSAQLAELIALTWALELGKGKRVAIYTDSKYALLMLQAHAAIWKERGQVTTRGSPIKYGDQILRLLEAVHLPAEVSVSHCKGHQKGSMEVARGNQAADQAAKRAEL